LANCARVQAAKKDNLVGRLDEWDVVTPRQGFEDRKVEHTVTLLIRFFSVQVSTEDL
jgi:hypothetical protein